MSEKTKEINDGGNTFPLWTGIGCGYKDGMSLRAYFAGQALAGLNANPAPQIADSIARVKAVWAVADADALIKELEKKL